MTVTKEQTAAIGLGEMKVTKDDSVVLTCLGLGSCVGMAAYDPVSKVAGMAHIVLPRSDGRSGLPAKFADTAIPALVDEMCKLDSLVKTRFEEVPAIQHI